MTDTQVLAGKNILITGAGRGLGKRLALGMASRGGKVGLLARSRGELDLAQLEIEQAGGVAMRLRADVRGVGEGRRAAAVAQPAQFWSGVTAELRVRRLG